MCLRATCWPGHGTSNPGGGAWTESWAPPRLLPSWPLAALSQAGPRAHRHGICKTQAQRNGNLFLISGRDLAATAGRAGGAGGRGRTASSAPGSPRILGLRVPPAGPKWACSGAFLRRPVPAPTLPLSLKPALWGSLLVPGPWPGKWVPPAWAPVSVGWAAVGCASSQQGPRHRVQPDVPSPPLPHAPGPSPDTGEGPPQGVSWVPLLASSSGEGGPGWGGVGRPFRHNPGPTAPPHQLHPAHRPPSSAPRRCRPRPGPGCSQLPAVPTPHGALLAPADPGGQARGHRLRLLRPPEARPPRL